MTDKEAVAKLKDSLLPYDEGYLDDEEDKAFEVIENAFNTLNKIKKSINRLYKKYKALDKTSIENCEDCQQAHFNLGAFTILEDLRKIIHEK